MNDFEHLDRYLSQAAEDEHVDEWTPVVRRDHSGWLEARREVFEREGIPEFFSDIPLLQALELQRQASRSSILPFLIKREQAAKSGVSELAARLSALYLEGTEEDEP